MAHDVFVSYPSADRTIADAIGMSRMMLLVFSEGMNRSDHILREVRAAGDAEIPHRLRTRKES